MKSMIPLLVILTANIAAADGVRNDVRQSFEMGNAPARLIVEASGSDVDVVATDGARVEVVVEREARTSDPDVARRQFEGIETSITREGDTVYVRVRRKSRVQFFSWSSQPRLDIRVRVPFETAVSVTTSGGDVSVAGTTLPAKLSTSGGDVELDGARGGSQVTTSGGDIEVRDHYGPINLSTSGGDILVERVDGDVTARTSGGDIEVSTRGGFVYARTSGGDIHLAGAIAGGNAQTSGGDVELDLTRSPQSPFDITSSGSGAIVRVGPGVGFELDASSSGDRVRTEVPITVRGEIDRRHVRGAVNGGGSLVTIRASGGSVRVVPLG